MPILAVVTRAVGGTFCRFEQNRAPVPAKGAEKRADGIAVGSKEAYFIFSITDWDCTLLPYLS